MVVAATAAWEDRMKKFGAVVLLFAICARAHGALDTNAANAALSAAVNRNDARAIVKAIDDGATNGFLMLTSITNNRAAPYKTFAVLEKASGEFIAFDRAIRRFCEGGRKLWSGVIADITVDDSGKETIFTYKNVKFDPKMGVQYEKTEATGTIDISESEKFVWRFKNCNYPAGGLGNEENYINCYFDVIEKYCRMDTVKKFYEDTVANARKDSEEEHRKEKMNRSPFHDLLYPPTQVAKNAVETLGQQRLDKLNEQIKSIETQMETK